MRCSRPLNCYAVSRRLSLGVRLLKMLENNEMKKVTLAVLTMIAATSAFAGAAVGWSFPLQEKTLALGMTFTAVKALFPKAVKPEDMEQCKKKVNKVSCTILENREEDSPDTVTLVFKDNKLDEIDHSGGTEGLTNDQKKFQTWMVKMYGKGKKTTKKPNVETRWSLPGALITESCYFGEDSGDVSCSYHIRATTSN